MTLLKSNNIIPFIIICFCLLIFIGILRNKKAEKINNIMENFINNNNFNNNNEHFDNKHTVDKNFTREYINGLWTSPGTTLDKENFATQLIEIDIKDKNNTKDKGFIKLPNVKGNKYFNGLKYNIILSTGMSVVGTSPDSSYTLSINTVDISKDDKYGKDGLLLTTNVPLAKVIFVDKNNNILTSIYSYKVPEHKKIHNGQLKDIIESNSYNGYEIKDKYDINSYIKIIGNYRFLKDSISFNFGVISNYNAQVNNYYNIIKNKYGGDLSFRIAREFTAPNGSTIKTQASEIYTLKAIKTSPNGDNTINYLPDKINIVSAKKDVELNKVNIKSYIPKSVIIYFYKTTNTTIDYNFDDSTKINESQFKFENNGQNMFSNKTINSNDLNSLTKTITADYTITNFKTIFTPNINGIISIPFSDLYSLL